MPTWAEFEILQAKFIELGVPTIVCDPRDLRFEDNRLTADGQAIDLVYRRVLINDILSRADDCRALTEAYAARAVCVANTFRCKVPHKKAFFAVLTDERFADLFTADEQATAARHIPWTRLVAEGRTTRVGRDIDLVPHIRANRHDLVLKPNDEYGGHGVTLGWEADEAAWDTLSIARLAAPGRLGRAGEDPRAPRAVPAVRRRRRRGHRRHAGGLRAVSLPRQAGRLPDAPQRDRPRQRHVGRRPGAVVRREPAAVMSISSAHFIRHSSFVILHSSFLLVLNRCHLIASFGHPRAGCLRASLSHDGRGPRLRRSRASSAATTCRRSTMRRWTSRCSTCTTAGRISGTTPSATRIQNIVCDLTPALRDAGTARARDCRTTCAAVIEIPEPPGGRHGIYIGTGGPGHLDPRLNDGVADGSQGIKEDPAWEPQLFALFDAIRADRDAALLAVCHTFGVMCRWLGIADVVLRGPEKGGKSSGIVDNLLTDAALEHPWFARLARELPGRRRLKILDNRLYDLLPIGPLPDGVSVLSVETLGVGGPAGDALTAIEIARDPNGIMPRIFGVNHHPEIVNRSRQLTILKKRMERGAVTPEWYAERAKALTEIIGDDRGDQLLHLTSSYMFLGPLRFHLYKQIRLRAETLGRQIDVDESSTPILASYAS